MDGGQTIGFDSSGLHETTFKEPQVNQGHTWISYRQVVLNYLTDYLRKLKVEEASAFDIVNMDFNKAFDQVPFEGSV